MNKNIIYINTFFLRATKNNSFNYIIKISQTFLVFFRTSPPHLWDMCSSNLLYKSISSSSLTSSSFQCPDGKIAGYLQMDCLKIFFMNICCLRTTYMKNKKREENIFCCPFICNFFSICTSFR